MALSTSMLTATAALLLSRHGTAVTSTQSPT